MIARPLEIAASHPAYDGHFPGRPILPAVVLLGEALAAVQFEAGDATAWTVTQAKFTRPVLPGTPLTLATESEGGSVRFEIRSPDGVVAAGAFARTPAAR